MLSTFIGRRRATRLTVVSVVIIQLGCSRTPPPSELEPLRDTRQTGSVSVEDFIEFAGMGDVDEVLGSLDQGMDVHAVNELGRTALMQAALYGRRKVVELLLDRGARVDRRDNEGRTALQYAATGPYAGTVRLLLEHGAEVDVVDSGEHFTALMFAAGEGQKEVIQVLLEYGADPSIEDLDGDTAVTHAMRRGHRAVVELLSAHQADTLQTPATATDE
jgi:ankyrin repeat protein